LARYQYLRLMRLGATPHSIALGLALGVFVGCLPIVPFQIALALPLAFFFGGNKITAMLATFISNPLNLPFFYYGLYRIGRMFLPLEGIPPFNPHHLELAAFFRSGWMLVATMFTGGIVSGVPLAAGTYFIARRAVVAWRKRRRLRLSRIRAALRRGREAL
jgi:uncharacterized protein (DUF2062 family)